MNWRMVEAAAIAFCVIPFAALLLYTIASYASPTR